MTINNRVVEAEEGQTILDVARENGIHIPTLCYLKGYTGTGVVVYVKLKLKVQELHGTCVYPVREGLVVKTNSQRAIEVRRQVVELIVSNHNKELPCLYQKRKL